MLVKFQNAYPNVGGVYLNWNGDPYNPLNLPPYTLRLKYKPDTEPYYHYGTYTLVDVENNIWDMTYSSNDWGWAVNNDTNVIEVLGGNTKNVTQMERMFLNCSAISSVNIFDTSNVTTMEGMFAWCKSISSSPDFDTSNVTSFNSTFGDCRSLTAAPNLNTSKAKNMNDFYEYCTKLTYVPNYDTSNVSSMNGMFDHCLSLVTPPMLNTENVKDMGYMFYECSSLSAVPLYNTTNVSSLHSTFQGCINVQSGTSALYQQASNQPNVPDHLQTFFMCGSATQQGRAELALIPSDWK